MVGILGPNGAGKTTLLRLLTGILNPSTGTVFLGGVSIKPLRRYLARWVGYLPQDFGLPLDLTAREYLEYYALLYNIGTRAERKSRINLLLDEVGLAADADKKIGGYSGGMRQRAAVARTLLRLPPVIVVDEPTVGLDPRERIRFRNLLGRLAKTRVVLFSTHVVEDVAVACERVIVLARGSMVFDDRPSLLAGEAAGRVWVARLNPEEEAHLPEDALIVDQVPETDGASRLRILCEKQPHPGAQPADPTLEDGYLRLVGYRVGKRTE
jgi:ABC-type multidrug transport system ATPase subunit